MKRRGELIKVGNLFNKYKDRIRAPQASVVIVFIDIVKDVCGITLEPQQISYTVSSRTVTIYASSILKHEVLRHSPDILRHCQGRLGDISCPKQIL